MVEVVWEPYQGETLVRMLEHHQSIVFRSWRDWPGKETQTSSPKNQTVVTSGRDELPKGEKDKTFIFSGVIITADQPLGTTITIY